MSTAPQPALELSANLQSPTEEFLAIDEYIRSYELQWVAIAQLAIRVRDRGLWRGQCCQRERKLEDGTISRVIGEVYSSWEDWVHDAAPVSARTIFSHIGLIRDLPDFTPTELATIPPETAKVLRQLSPSVRRDPRVREAARGRKKGFIEAVREFAPDQHIETDYAIMVSESTREEFYEGYEEYRAEDPGVSVNDFVLFLVREYRSVDHGGLR